MPASYKLALAEYKDIVQNTESRGMTSQMNLIDVGDGPPILAASDNNQENNNDNMERFIKEMMWSETVQNMVKRRYLPKYIQEALTRMYDLYKHRWEEITEALIMEELNRLKMEKNMSDDDLKIPNADNMRNISASRELEQLQRENAAQHDALQRLSSSSHLHQ
uniref:Uncharacterized protein LOC111099834 n=1 Tax=Crassostrea virginica TaxID=6565 RepID=A0A8B8A8S7_CRAVI|nr:uncharacterized protein LOC111099834 [Crassostrea virginica]